MRYALTVITALLLSSTVHAQVGVRLTVNVGSQPVWGPTGYDYAGYYYFPDIETYYNVPEQRFIYLESGHWKGSYHLPYRHRHYDLYNAYKVVVNEDEPFRNHPKYRDEYLQDKGRRGQLVIRDSRDSRYFVIKEHPEHNNWMKQQKHDNGHGNGNGNGNNGKKN